MTCPPASLPPARTGPRTGRALSVLLVLSGPPALAESPEVLPEAVVVAERLPEDPGSLASWNTEEITGFSPRTIDELLATDPSFSLYRRQPAIFSNPTAAGVSLRRTGATAASRTLVLRDGIPQNDPFGGWVSWGRYHPDLLGSARLVPSARATVWGNQSPAGIVQLTSRWPREERSWFRATLGDRDTRGLSAATQFVSSDSRFSAQVGAFTLQSDGFHALAADQRGAVDRPRDFEMEGLEARFRWQGPDGLTVEPAISYYDESRGNGTVLSGNSTEALDLSLRVTSEGPDRTWQGLIYYQRRTFAALFSSVGEGRNTETPALDQFEVPGEGIGGGLTARLPFGDRGEVMLGADLRHLTGETNERAGFVDGAFLRRRRAGGGQTFGGLFVRGSQGFPSETQLEASARLDFWELRDGERVERRPSSGALLRDLSYPDRDGLEPSFSLQVSHPLNDALTLTASAGTSFRLPTLNELYRPFRVRNDITEANAGLKPERFFSVEGGAAWEPHDDLSLGLAFFYHRIEEAIANVPITDADEASAVAGFVPPGGSVAQRRNVEEARSWGLEARAHWQARPNLLFSLTYLWGRSEFTESPGQPLLEGKRFPQAPNHRLVAGVEANPTEQLSLFLQADYGSGQFDDALEERRLPSWWSVRCGAGLDITENLSLSLRVENLFDEDVTTGLSSSGLRSIGLPRSGWLDLRYQF